MAAESPPGTFSDDGVELEMERGGAYERTEGAVVWVDARCVGCQRARVDTLPPDDWKRGASFADYCPRCGVLTPHNILAILHALNHQRERGHTTITTDD